jgi:ABC-2 type transport system ATP-binding protein
VQGPGVVALRPRLERQPGVEQVAPFGDTLHVTGTDRAALLAAIEPLRADSAGWTEDETSLEDLFIHLLRSRRRGAADARARLLASRQLRTCRCGASARC